MNFTILGKEGYESYCYASGNKSLVSGCELPKWEELRPEIKTAWIASATAIIELGKVLNV